MTKVTSKYPNSGINLSYEENDMNFNTETEKCLKISTPSGKLRFIILCTCLTILAFAVGLVIGFFTKNKTCGNDQIVINHHKDHTTNRQTFLNVLDKEEIRQNVRYFSLEPHLAGSLRSKELAEEIKTRWNNYGFHVDTLEYEVLLPRPKNDSPDYMEIKDHNGKVAMKHTFAAVGKSDPASNRTWSTPQFLFYSPSGQSLNGGLLYVNKGTKQDFQYLKTINITCNGSVVMMKYSYYNMLEQLKNAHDCNASAILFIFDGRPQTAGKGAVYPNGTRLPKEQPLVHGLRRNVWEVGDPLTPNLPASEGIYRVDNVDWPAKLPVQYVASDFALKLLQQLAGSPLPANWTIDNTKDYRIGPTLKNNSRFYLTVNSKAEMTKIYDVIGTVYGREEPDAWVLIGNHRDAMVFGACDAGSGTAGMMELSRGIGKLLKKGWKPRRTIKFCSWAAEEMGVIGSTEYVQDNKRLLQERAVAYINLDMLVHGNDSLKACGNPMMVDLVYEQSKMVPDPHGPQESIYSMWQKGRPDPTATDRPQFYTTPYGSDYIPFYEMAGVPSIDLQYGKVPYNLPQSYHTVYDTYHLISMFDPHFLFHLAQTKLAARLLYELSNLHLIPFNINSFTNSLRKILNRTNLAYSKELEQHGISLNEIFKEVNELAKAGRKFEKIKNKTNPKTNPGQVRILNRRMIAFNKLFISPEPIPGRSTLRNLVHGISQNYQYPNITLAGISDALIKANTSGRWDIVKRQVSLTLHAITQARRSLEMPS